MFGKKDSETNAEGAQPSGEPRDSAEAPKPAEDLKVAEYRDQMLRMKAEFENVKKRLERDKSDAVKYANEKILVDVLQIADNFERALSSIDQGHDPAKVKQGLSIVRDELKKVLERHGVETVSSVGAPFDPNLHEAVGIVETDDAEDGTVVDEVQKGYFLNGRLIRPSRVRVAQAAKK